MTVTKTTRGWALWVGLCLGLASAATGARAADADTEAKEKAATTAGASWLAMVDAGKYAESWTAASDHFRNAISKDAWVQQLDAARKPFGDVGKRALTSRGYTKTLPGAPDGEYVVLQYDTSFSGKKGADETVTTVLSGGAWKVAGYFIK